MSLPSKLNGSSDDEMKYFFHNSPQFTTEYREPHPPLFPSILLKTPSITSPLNAKLSLRM